MPEQPDVLVSHISGLPSEVVSELLAPLEAAGVDVEVEDRGVSIYAAVEWLIPTAVVVILSSKYVETILQEAAKDHYALVKAGLARLLQRLVGKDRDIKVQVVTSSSTVEKLSSEGPSAMSVYVSTRGGKLVKFIFEDTLTASHREYCLDALFTLLQQHNASFPEDPLSTSIEAAGLEEARAILMRYDPLAVHWYVWKPRLGPPGK